MDVMNALAGTLGKGVVDQMKTTRAERLARNSKATGVEEPDADDAGFRRLKSIRYAVELEEPYSDEDLTDSETIRDIMLGDSSDEDNGWETEEDDED